MSRGRPTLTESKRSITSFSNLPSEPCRRGPHLIFISRIGDSLSELWSKLALGGGQQDCNRGHVLVAWHRFGSIRSGGSDLAVRADRSKEQIPVCAVASVLPPQQRWSLDSIDWHAVRSGAVDGEDPLFYLVAAASFIEITTDLYTQNLIDQFSENAEIASWLARRWLAGRIAARPGATALRPDSLAGLRVGSGLSVVFGRVHRLLYGQGARADPQPRDGGTLRHRNGGQLGYYTMLSRLSPEPVLATLARRIAEDEVRHYKHFYRYFRRFRATENTGRIAVSQALWSRLGKIDGEDSWVAVKHLYLSRYPHEVFDDKVYRACVAAPRPYPPPFPL